MTLVDRQRQKNSSRYTNSVWRFVVSLSVDISSSKSSMIASLRVGGIVAWHVWSNSSKNYMTMGYYVKHALQYKFAWIRIYRKLYVLQYKPSYSNIIATRIFNTSILASFSDNYHYLSASVAAQVLQTTATSLYQVFWHDGTTSGRSIVPEHVLKIIILV